MDRSVDWIRIRQGRCVGRETRWPSFQFRSSEKGVGPMATTVYAARTQELRNRIARMNKDTPFQIIYGNFDEFCGLRRLSRIQIAFARKRLVELRDLFPDEAAQSLF